MFPGMSQPDVNSTPYLVSLHIESPTHLSLNVNGSHPTKPRLVAPPMHVVFRSPGAARKHSALSLFPTPTPSDQTFSLPCSPQILVPVSARRLILHSTAAIGNVDVPKLSHRERQITAGNGFDLQTPW